jgi:hypothetical protein
MSGCALMQKFPKNTPPEPLSAADLSTGLRIFRYKPRAGAPAAGQHPPRPLFPGSPSRPDTTTARPTCACTSRSSGRLWPSAPPAARPRQALHRRPGLSGRAVAWVLRGEQYNVEKPGEWGMFGNVGGDGTMTPTPTPMPNRHGRAPRDKHGREHQVDNAPASGPANLKLTDGWVRTTGRRD